MWLTKYPYYLLVQTLSLFSQILYQIAGTEETNQQVGLINTAIEINGVAREREVQTFKDNNRNAERDSFLSDMNGNLGQLKDIK